MFFLPEATTSGRSGAAIADNGGIKDTKAYLGLTAASAIWGFSWLCGRVIASEGAPAAQAALCRFLFGSAGLAVLMAWRRGWTPAPAPLVLRLLAMGFFGVFLYNVCFFEGLRTVPAGRASLMAALQPSVIYLFAAIVWRSRVRGVHVVGLALSLLGAALVISQGDVARLFQTGLGRGDLWILGCVFAWVAYTLLGRGVVGVLPTVAATAYSTWMGSLLLAAYAAASPAPVTGWSARTWLSIAFLGLGATTTAFLLYLDGLQRIGASRASIFINLVPVFGVAFGVVILGEPVHPAALAGGALAIAGVRLLNR